MVQWAVAYGAGALVLLEIADFLAEAFEWPAIALRMVTVLVGFVFLAVLVIAWYHGEKGHQGLRMSEVLLLAIIAMVGLSTAWWVGMGPASAETRVDATDEPRLASEAPALERTGVAVLPFVTIGGDSTDQSFADGITEDIIAELAQIGGLRVISRTSVTQYKGTEKSITDIGQELGVEIVLEGSVRRVGDDVRIVAQLIDARTDEHVWTETYEPNIKNILQTQSEVARDIAAQLSQVLGSHVQLADAAERPEVDPAAFDLYIQGRTLAESESPEDRARAAELLKEALRRDSNLVAAYSTLAEIAAPPEAPMPDIPAVPPGAEMAEIIEEGLKRAPHVPALNNFSIRRALQQNDLAGAEQEARRAIEANPNNASALRYLALLVARDGRLDEALQRLREAQAVDPHSPVIATDIGKMLYEAGRYDEAIRHLEEVLEHHPEHVDARLSLGLAYQANGASDKAEAVLREAAEQARGNPMVLGTLGYVFAMRGDTGRARIVLEGLQAADQARTSSLIAAAQILGGLGDRTEAARWLQRAVTTAESQEWATSWMSLDPRFRRLFGDSLTDSLGARFPRPPQRR